MSVPPIPLFPKTLANKKDTLSDSENLSIISVGTNDVSMIKSSVKSKKGRKRPKTSKSMQTKKPDKNAQQIKRHESIGSDLTINKETRSFQTLHPAKKLGNIMQTLQLPTVLDTNHSKGSNESFDDTISSININNSSDGTFHSTTLDMTLDTEPIILRSKITEDNSFLDRDLSSRTKKPRMDTKHEKNIPSNYSDNTAYKDEEDHNDHTVLTPDPSIPLPKLKLSSFPSYSKRSIATKEIKSVPDQKANNTKSSKDTMKESSSNRSSNRSYRTSGNTDSNPNKESRQETIQVESFEEEKMPTNQINFLQVNAQSFLNTISEDEFIFDFGSLYTHFQLAFPHTQYSEKDFQMVIHQVESILRSKKDLHSRVDIVYTDSWILDAFDILDKKDSSLVTMENVFIVICLMIGKHKAILQQVWGQCANLVWELLLNESSEAKIDIMRARSVARLARVDDWTVTHAIWKLNWYQYHNEQMMDNKPFIDKDMLIHLYNNVFLEADNQHKIFDPMALAMSIYEKNKSVVERNQSMHLKDVTNLSGNNQLQTMQNRNGTHKNEKYSRSRSSLGLSPSHLRRSFLFPGRRNSLTPALENLENQILPNHLKYEERKKTIESLPIDSSIAATPDTLPQPSELHAETTQVMNISMNSISTPTPKEVDNDTKALRHQRKEGELKAKVTCCTCVIL